MTQVIIEGTAKASFTFWDLPSWNAMPNNRWVKSNLIKSLRLEAHSMVSKFKLGLPRDLRHELLVNRAFVLVRVLTPTEGIADVPNLNVKHTFDGFTDAKVWVDDEWPFVPLVLFAWNGMDENPKFRLTKQKRRMRMRRAIIEVHELEEFVINGQAQVLPKGRKSLPAYINWAKWEKISMEDWSDEM